MSDEGNEEIDPHGQTRAEPRDRSPTQQALHDDVKGALFRDGPRATEHQSGTVLAGRYRIASLLGRGGMGEVYRAHDLELDEDVAIKFLPKEFARNEALMRRFVGEVRIARQITHPAVCRVHDIGEADGRRFLSMEFIDGEDLASLLRRIGRLPFEKAMELAQQLCAGLAALHDKGVLHRDLKPANVMIDGRGRLKLADFGLAVMETELRAEELRDGTPAYMAPEQARGEAVTVRSDIYALGLVLHELVTGRHPTRDRSSNAATGGENRTPADVQGRLASPRRDVEEVIAACLDPDPNARPQSALAVAAALPGGDPVAAAIAAGVAPSVHAIANLGKQGSIKPWLAWLCTAVVVASLSMLAVMAPSTSILGRTKPQLPPDVLRHRCTTLLADAGIERPSRDTWTDLHFESRYFERDREGADDWASRRLDATGPAPIIFVYRQRPVPLIPRGDGINASDPPVDFPGEVLVSVDGRGHLRDLRVVPPYFGVEAGDPYDFSVLLGATGLDPVAAQPVPPSLTPRIHCDQRQAWAGVIEATGTRVQVEACAYGGEPVYLHTTTPWDPPGDTRALVAQMDAQGVTPWLVALAIAAVLSIFIALARRSILRREADIPGAFKVTMVLVLVLFAAGLLSGHHGGPAVEITLWIALARTALFTGGLLLVCYVIVEPYGRRLLPGAMVSWTRLVTGKWRDRLVARDVLFGLTLGVAIIVADRAQAGLTTSGPQPQAGDLQVLFGARHAIGGLAQITSYAVIGVVQLFALFVVIRLAVRGPKRAAAAFFLLWTVLNYLKYADVTGIAIAANAALSVVTALALVVLVTRLGLLATVSTQLAANILVFYPLTTEAAAWYGSTTLIGVASLSALALFGWRAVQPSGSGAAAPSSPATRDRG